MVASNPIEGPKVSAIAAATEGVDVDALVRQAQGGDTDAFQELVQVFSGPMYNLAYRMTGNAADAGDLTQEIFVKLYKAIGKFRWRAKFSTWLYRIATNTCCSGLRKIRRVASVEAVHLDDTRSTESRPREAPDTAESPSREAELNELQQRIEETIMMLPEDFRAVIVLRDLQGLAYDEIAVSVGCSIGTVKSRLARARMRVKEQLVRQGIVV
jgi:RNA polymerase sigma-70 factor, ECF subfamily